MELLRTCVASIPRCAPDSYSTEELVEFLSRCTIHCDHDLNVFAFSALQSLQEHNPAIRPDIIKGKIVDVSDNILVTISLYLAREITTALRIQVYSVAGGIQVYSVAEVYRCIQ